MAKKFTVDANAIIHLGRESIKDHSTAMIELVKNSYDADATCVLIELVTCAPIPYIRIVDNGSGMSSADIEDSWLRIGYSNKTTKKTSVDGRRYTGEKGIGRLSADRLGSVLSLRTKKRAQKHEGLLVNWDIFKAGISLSDIEIEETANPIFSIPSFILKDDINRESDVSKNILNHVRSTDLKANGTELIIFGLRHEWNKTDVIELRKELSLLVSPFVKTIDFTVFLNTDLDNEYEIAPPELLDNYEIKLEIVFDANDPLILYDLYERDEDNVGKKVYNQDEIRREELIQNDNLGKDFGQVSATILFFPQISELVEDTSHSLKDLGKFLKATAGIKIYRDNIRVKPYGDLRTPEGDWFGLGARRASNPAGAGRKGYMASPGQLVGAVFVSRDSNPNLIDSAGREGLLQGEALDGLKEFMVGCVRIISARYHKRFSSRKKVSIARKLSPSEEIRKLNSELNSLQKKLLSIRTKLPKNSVQEVTETVELMGSVDEQIRDTQKAVDDLETQARSYRGLASLGISTSVFGHEIQSSIDMFLGRTTNLQGYLDADPPAIEKAKRALDDSRTHAKLVKNWGNFALDRVRRDKRTNKLEAFDQIIKNLIDRMNPAMGALKIKVDVQLDEIKARIYPVDLETIVMNLVTNAYSACTKKRKDRSIRIELNRHILDSRPYCEIVVADSGFGVAKQFVEEIWSPLFTTKSVQVGGKEVKDGTGLGLTIVRSVVEDLNGSKSVTTDEELGGAKFIITFPIREG